MTNLKELHMKMIPLNDLSRISDDEVEFLTNLFREVCASGQYLKGVWTNRFEVALSQIFSGRDVVSVANGTDALTLAVAALRLHSDSVVAVAPNAGGYGTTAVRRLGLRTTFVDVDEVSAQMDPESLRNALQNNPTIGAVIVTHLFGLSGRIEEISDICREFDVPLIEDCAQSIGARVNSKPIGTFGSMATLSFYPTKNLGGMGDAGAVVCATAELSQLVSQLAQYGWGSRYSIEMLNGFNSRIDEIQAGILHCRLSTLEIHNEHRREIIQTYNKVLPSNRRMIFDASERFVGHLAVMVTPHRASDIQFLEKAGIGTGIHYPILDFDQPAWKTEQNVHTPAAKRLSDRILTLPCFPTMSQQEVDYVCSVLGQLS